MGYRMICLDCGTALESRHRHDFQKCPCPNEAHVDGGNDYLKCGAVNPTRLIRCPVDSRWHYRVVRIGKERMIPQRPDDTDGVAMQSFLEASFEAQRASREGYTGIIYYGPREERLCPYRLGTIAPHDPDHIDLVSSAMTQIIGSGGPDGF